MKDKKCVKENNKDEFLINISNNISTYNNELSSNRNSINEMIIYDNEKQKNTLEFFFSLSKLCISEKIDTSKIQSFSINSRYSKHSKFIYNKYFSAVQKTLNKKYFFSRNDCDSMIIDCLIYNSNCHIVSQFKEFMIIDYVEEFLKRSYKVGESLERIPKFANYYKNYLKFFCNPTFRDFRANTILQNFGDNKAELYYNRNYLIKNKFKQIINTQSDDNQNIFNTTIKNNIEKNSLTHTQNTIRNDVVEMSINNLDGFKPNIDKYYKANNFINAREEVIYNKYNKDGNEIENKNDPNNSTNLALEDDFNFNLNSFADRTGMYTKVSAEVSLLNLLTHLNKNNEAGSSRNLKYSKLKFTKSMYKPNVKIVKKITKSNENKIMKEFEEKIIKSTSPREIIKSFVSVKTNKYFDTIPLLKMQVDKKSLMSYNSPLNDKSGKIKTSCSKDIDRSNNILYSTHANYIADKNSNQTKNNFNQFKSTKSFNMNLLKNPKINKKENLRSMLPNNNLITSAQTNNVKNNYNDFNNLYPDMYSNTTVIKKFNNINNKESTNINNSNFNTPFVNPNKTLNKLPNHIVTSEENNKNKQNKEETNSAIEKSIYTKITKQKISLKNNKIVEGKASNDNLKKSSSNLNPNQIDIINNNFSSNNRIIKSWSFNQNEMQNNNVNTNSANDIMKITLSLYMDKSNRNRIEPGIGRLANQHLIRSHGMTELFDISKKPSLSGKVDSINNFNININNQININEPQINCNEEVRRESFTKLNTAQRKTSLDLNKNLNNNLKCIIEKNKNLSRNKNQSLYKFPTNQTKSNNIGEDDEIFHTTTTKSNKNITIKRENIQSTSNKKMFNSCCNANTSNKTNAVDGRQIYYTKNDMNIIDEDFLANNEKNKLMIKNSIEDYKQIKKNSNIKSNLKSSIKLNSNFSSSKNKKLLSANMKFLIDPSKNDKKINKIKLNDNNDLKKIINSPNFVNQINPNMLNILNSKNNSKLMNLYQITNSIRNRYFSPIKK